MDRRTKQIIVIGMSLILAVVGVLYQTNRNEDRPSLKRVAEVFKDGD